MKKLDDREDSTIQFVPRAGGNSTAVLQCISATEQAQSAMIKTLNPGHLSHDLTTSSSFRLFSFSVIMSERISSPLGSRDPRIGPQ